MTDRRRRGVVLTTFFSDSESDHSAAASPEGRLSLSVKVAVRSSGAGELVEAYVHVPRTPPVPYQRRDPSPGEPAGGGAAPRSASKPPEHSVGSHLAKAPSEAGRQPCRSRQQSQESEESSWPESCRSLKDMRFFQEGVATEQLPPGSPLPWPAGQYGGAVGSRLRRARLDRAVRAASPGAPPVEGQWCGEFFRHRAAPGERAQSPFPGLLPRGGHVLRSAPLQSAVSTEPPPGSDTDSCVLSSPSSAGRGSGGGAGSPSSASTLRTRLGASPALTQGEPLLLPLREGDGSPGSILRSPSAPPSVGRGLLLQHGHDPALRSQQRAAAWAAAELKELQRQGLLERELEEGVITDLIWGALARAEQLRAQEGATLEQLLSERLRMHQVGAARAWSEDAAP